MKSTAHQKWIASLLALILAFGSFGADALAAVLTLPSDIRIIEEEAFYGTTSLDEVVVPEGATEIRSKAFANSSLNSIELPESIRFIADDAFLGCDPDVTMYGKPGSYAEDYALENGISFNTGSLPDNESELAYEYIITDGKCTITKYLGTESNVIVPDSIGGYTVTRLEYPAFRGCSFIESIWLPDTMEFIGFDCFEGCTSLKKLNYPANIISCYAWYDASATLLYHNPNLETIIIPEGVTYLNGSGMLHCPSIKYLKVPDSAFGADPSAFKNLVLLQALGLPKDFSCSLNGSGIPKQCIVYSIAGGSTEKTLSLYGYHFSTDPFPFSESTPSPVPTVPSFTMDAVSVSTGVEVTFQVQAKDAGMVQLMVDGIGYDMKVVENGTAVLSRAFTLAGVREIAFRSYVNGVWGEPCTAQKLTVEAAAQLDAPVIECKTKVWTGEPLTVKWNAVENAEGYTVYLTDVSGKTTSWEYGSNLRTHTIPAEFFSSTGECNVLVMAYGTGYSQSSARKDITVTDEYIPWTGYVQYSTTNTYSTSDCDVVNGYVDYIDPVTVLNEENGAYLIEMILTSGGTAQRWVVKSAIGTAPYVPELTLTASYSAQGDQVILRAKTNLQGVKAGVMLNGAMLGSSTKPQSSSTYSKTFSFIIAAPSAKTVYTVWAEDDDENRLTADVVVPAYIPPTPTPEATAQPTVAPSPEVTVSPTATPEPDDTGSDESADEAIPLPSEPKPSEAPVSCINLVNGVHSIVLSDLEKLRLLCTDDGRLKILESRCTRCGMTISGYLPEKVTMQFYFHPLLKYYDTSANNAVYEYFSSYESLLCNAPLTVTTDLNLNGASISVNGKLTVEGHLKNVSSIECSELEIKNGGHVSMVNGGNVNVSGKITVNGTLTGADTVNCSSRFYVGKSGVMAMIPDFHLTAGGKFEFHSDVDLDHSAYFGQKSKITAAGMKISGTKFQFNGTFASTDKSLSMDNTDQNYVGTLDLTALGGLVDYAYGKFFSTLPSSTNVRFDALVCDAYTTYAWSISDQMHDALYPVWGGDMITPVVNSDGELDEEFYAAAVEAELNNDYGIEKPVYDVTFTTATTQGVLAEEAASVVSGVLEEEDVFARPTDKNGVIKLGSTQYGLYTSSDEEDVYKYNKHWTVSFNGFSSILSSDVTDDISKVKLYTGTVTCTSEGSGFSANYLVTSTKESLQDAAASIVNIGEAEFKEIQKSILAGVIDDALFMLATKATVAAMEWHLMGDEYTLYDGEFVEMREFMDSVEMYVGMYDDVQTYLDAAQNVAKYHN